MRSLRFIKLVCVVGLALVVAGCALFDSPPTAQFTWTPSEPMSKLQVTFTDLSTDSGGPFGGGGIVSWIWDFGDSSTSTAPSPKHTYQKGGTYTVRLTVTDDAGQQATFSRQITVTPSLDGTWSGFITNIFFIPIALTLNLSHSSTGNISGMVTIGAVSQPATGGSFNPATREVQVNCAGFDLILRGTLDATETRIEGYWYDDNTGQRGEDWWVTR